MILSFADRTTEDIFHGPISRHARRIPAAVWPAARRKLDLLNRATSLTDLRVPPANRLEKLHGARAGSHSIRVNDQFRVVFHFEDGNVLDVAVCDYH